MDKIDKLKARVDKNREGRQRAATADERANARQRSVDKAPATQEMDFYCPECVAHYFLVGRKVVEHGYNVTTGQSYPVSPVRASFVARCPKKGHSLRRYITDAWMDPYLNSPILRHQAWLMRDELLQPSDPRFKTVYPKEWAKMEAEREEAEMLQTLTQRR